MADVTEKMIEVAWTVAYQQGIHRPYMARVADYPEPTDLQIADSECEALNNGAMRKVLEAVMEAAGVDRMRKMLTEIGFCPDCGEALPCMTCGHGL